MTLAQRKKIALIFGGPSTEHEVSINSASNVSKAVDNDLFEKVLIGISKEGSWYLLTDVSAIHEIQVIDKDHLLPSFEPITLILENSQVFILNLKHFTKTPIDAAFPILHGAMGEDGSIQGFFEILKLPYVGCGVLASALGMDKEIMKRLLNQEHINNSSSLVLKKARPLSYSKVGETLGMPFFIKPARTGSSIGVHKIHNEQEYTQGLADAFKYDDKVLAEKFIKGREIECSVMGTNSAPKASLPGEVVPKHEFYSYDAKYIDAQGALLVIPAELPKSTVLEIQQIAKKTYTLLECEGLARVDFFLTEKNEIYVNEINTIPGFTKISMYPKMWESTGLSYKNLITELIQLSFETFARKEELTKCL